ncbi:hypothetical protein JCM19235_2961 [Vibrio maritimus]|uniref:Uncharacterized protein n=1 Tax=Vibrio maritimus TaxID=990268 RepID=A0A090S3X7_9VIBR|nr:hypothetical protein JCM19235_2961 [Vibrio maritimus]
MIDFDVLRSYMDNDEDIIAAVFMAFMEEHENGAEKIQSLYNEAKLERVVHHRTFTQRYSC